MNTLDAIVVTAVFVLVGAVAYAATRLLAWRSYMQVLQSTIAQTGSADPLRDVAGVARALSGWDATPAIVRTTHPPAHGQNGRGGDRARRARGIPGGSEVAPPPR